MSKFFANLIQDPSADTSRQKSDAVINSEMDDLDMPPGEEPSIDEMAKVAQSVSELVTPDTAKPRLARLDSNVPLVSTAGSSDPLEDEGNMVGDDPHDDVLSINTDINQHKREIAELSQKMSLMMGKIDVIPSMDTRLRQALSDVEELSSTVKSLKTDIDQVKKSFNMYQSATANKIADVERRAAEKQLSTTAEPDSVLEPPVEMKMHRDPLPSTNRQTETLMTSAVTTPVVQKKKANMSEW